MKRALLSLTVALASCATGPTQQIPLRTIPKLEAPVRSVQLRVVDRRSSRVTWSRSFAIASKTSWRGDRSQ